LVKSLHHTGMGAVDMCLWHVVIGTGEVCGNLDYENREVFRCVWKERSEFESYSCFSWRSERI